MSPASFTTRSPATRPRRALTAVAVLAVYITLSLVLFSSAWRDPFRITIGGVGDPELFTWLLAWTPFALTHAQDPLLTYHLNFPEGANLMWNGAQAVPGLLLWPVLAAAGPTFAFNIMMTLSLPLSGWCAYFALRRLVVAPIAAAVGGLLYGFSPYMLDHALGHPNFVICLLPPLTLLFLYEILVRQIQPAWLPGTLLGLVAGAQLLTGEELLATTALIDAIGVVALIALFPRKVRPRFRHATAGLGVALVVSLVLWAYPLKTQFFGPQATFGEVRAHDFYVNDLLTFFVPSQLYLVAPDTAVRLTQRWTGNPAEWNGYVGVPLAILLGWIAWKYRSAGVVRWAALLGVVVAILSMGPHLHLAGRIRLRVPLPWILVQDLPVFRDILPARLSLYMFLAAAVGVAYFVDRLVFQEIRWRTWVGWAALGIAFIPLLPRLPWPSDTRPVPSFFTTAEVQRIPDGSVALVIPYATEPGTQPDVGAARVQAVDPQIWQIYSGFRFRMPEGYMRIPGPNGETISGPLPTNTEKVLLAIAGGSPEPPLTPELRQAMAADLEHWQARTVIVGPMDNQAAARQLFTDLLGRPPETVGGVYVWWDVNTASIATGG